MRTNTNSQATPAILWATTLIVSLALTSKPAAASLLDHAKTPPNAYAPLAEVTDKAHPTASSAPAPTPPQPSPPYPPSSFITGITFDMPTLRNEAPGSDNWAITWAGNGHQYATWGDGGGFGGTDDIGRVSMGIARIEGGKDNYQGFNVWGGHKPENPAQFTGKSYGLLAIDNTLYMWRTGQGTGTSAYGIQDLYVSTDLGATWQATGVAFEPEDFPNSAGFFAPTFLQFGRGYQGARDNYVYSYAPEIQDQQWDVQKPGRIALMRVPKDRITERAAYEFFAGFDDQGQPIWRADVSQRQAVFSHSDGVMRTSVSYNAGLGRYLLITQLESRLKADNGRIGIYEAAQPWGPWSQVLEASPWQLGLQTGSKTVYWNFSNKWASADGRDFVLVYTGAGGDEWGTVEGHFTVTESATPQADLRVILQGPYDATTQSMSTALCAAGHLPQSQPFAAARFDGTRLEHDEVVTLPPDFCANHPDVVDWILVDLYGSGEAMARVLRKPALLRRDGQVVDVDGSSLLSLPGLAPGSYYVVVRHRNHLPVMSAQAVDFTGGTGAWDFTTAQTQAYDDAARPGAGMSSLADGRFAMTAGDVNADGIVRYDGAGNDCLTISQILGGTSAFLQQNGYHAGDVNLDGIVKYDGSGNDRQLISQTIGGTNAFLQKVSQVPEP